MSGHEATVSWTLAEGEDFLAGRYSRRHRIVVGDGLCIDGSASTAVVKPPFAQDDAMDPESAFVAALSACHMLWFLDFARRAGVVVTRYEDQPVGVLGRLARGKVAMTRCTLRPRVACQPFDAAQQAELHHAAHAACFIANSVTTEVVVEPRS